MKRKIFCAKCGKETKHKRIKDNISHWYECQEHTKPSDTLDQEKEEKNERI